MSNLLNLSSITDLPELQLLTGDLFLEFSKKIGNTYQSYKVSLNTLYNFMNSNIKSGFFDDSGDGSIVGLFATNISSELTNIFILRKNDPGGITINYSNNKNNGNKNLSDFMLANDERTNTNFLRCDGTDNAALPYVKINNEDREIYTIHDLCINTNDNQFIVINSDNNKINACATSACWN